MKPESVSTTVERVATSQWTKRILQQLGACAMVFPILLGLGVVTPLAQAQTYKVLYSFIAGTDGAVPYAGLVMDAKGGLYGTTYLGGPSHSGTAYKVTDQGKETVLHSFGGADGILPYAGLIMDSKGNFYGTTQEGGPDDHSGTVYKMNSKGKETVLYSFTLGTDGGIPLGGLVMDSNGLLYGTTSAGGISKCSEGCGTVFKVNSKGLETVLYSFTGDTDGANPYAGLVMDTKGNLYGTTLNGGVSGAGTVFKVTKAGKETVLYSFKGSPDGASPFAGLIRDVKGSLYGTTGKGGASGNGTVFKLTATGKETVLHNFTAGTDGQGPVAGLLMDAKGNLYGTTSAGGGTGCNGKGCGTVFKLNSKGKETVLHRFNAAKDGAIPYAASLIMDAKGNLYGTAASGGSGNSGTVFRLTP